MRSGQFLYKTKFKKLYNGNFYTYIFVYLTSEIERGEERGERDREREERGEMYMYKRGQIYKYKTYLYKNRPDIQIKIV